MIILAIDPGPQVSSSVIYDTQNGSIDANTEDNKQLLAYLRRSKLEQTVVIEQVASYGMAVGEDVFETVYWSGQFAEAFQARSRTVERIKRHAVKQHVCHDTRAKDSNIRQALIDRFGAQGTKKQPGKTYGLKGGEWQALALAVTYAETTNQGVPA